jgi:transcriptional regulator
MSVDLSEIAALRERARQACEETERLRAERQQIYIAIDQSWERIKESRRTLNVVKDVKWILDLKTCADS